ncbi:MAG TPA: Arc family DNA-binding protein [Chthonomonadales bacterium]|nr:Arc family DNA-binding protein [Chthonomonadales bacterium]
MPRVLVRSIDPAVIEKLKARARQNGRSPEGELQQVLRQAATESVKEDIQTI